MDTSSPQVKSIVLGGGCFWCLEAAYEQINGVRQVVSGYAGGKLPNPRYESVVSGHTGHVEVVKIDFDTQVISLAELLEIFWVIHDPTTLNRQGHDIGSQYRSVIFYGSQEQESIAKASITEVAKLWTEPIVTELAALTQFYPAEDYHQHYFAKNPANAYCQVVINPKLAKLRESFADRLKA